MRELVEAIDELKRRAKRVGDIDRQTLRTLHEDVDRLRLALLSLDEVWLEFCEHVEGIEGAKARELISSLELILARHRAESLN